MTTYSIGYSPTGYALVRWLGGVPTRLGVFATEAAAIGALVAARAGLAA